MINVKARNARPLIDILSPRHWHFPVRRNSRAIANFRNIEINYFAPKMVDHDSIRGSLERYKNITFKRTEWNG
jgi:hypothetical protein